MLLCEQAVNSLICLIIPAKSSLTKSTLLNGKYFNGRNHFSRNEGEMILKVAVHIAQIRTGCAELIAVL